MSLKPWNWIQPVMNFLYASICAWDFVAGCFALYHHHVGVALANFCGACIVGVWAFFLNRAHEKHNRAMAQLQRQIEDIERWRHMTDMERVEADVKALRNLEQIAAATGARLQGPHRAWLTIGDVEFRVDVGNVYRTKKPNPYEDSTCYQMNFRVPYCEMIASVLLLLKNDPTIFDRWMRRDGYHV